MLKANDLFLVQTGTKQTLFVVPNEKTSSEHRFSLSSSSHSSSVVDQQVLWGENEGGREEKKIRIVGTL